jgi:hypothetical protein
MLGLALQAKLAWDLGGCFQENTSQSDPPPPVPTRPSRIAPDRVIF